MRTALVVSLYVCTLLSPILLLPAYLVADRAVVIAQELPEEALEEPPLIQERWSVSPLDWLDYQEHKDLYEKHADERATISNIIIISGIIFAISIFFLALGILLLITCLIYHHYATKRARLYPDEFEFTSLRHPIFQLASMTAFVSLACYIAVLVTTNGIQPEPLLNIFFAAAVVRLGLALMWLNPNLPAGDRLVEATIAVARQQAANYTPHTPLKRKLGKKFADIKAHSEILEECVRSGKDLYYRFKNEGKDTQPKSWWNDNAVAVLNTKPNTSRILRSMRPQEEAGEEQQENKPRKLTRISNLFAWIRHWLRPFTNWVKKITTTRPPEP